MFSLNLTPIYSVPLNILNLALKGHRFSILFGKKIEKLCHPTGQWDNNKTLDSVGLYLSCP